MAEAAKATGRSMNAEIVARLEKSLEQKDELSDLQELVAHLEGRISEMDERLSDIMYSIGRRDYSGNR